MPQPNAALAPLLGRTLVIAAHPDDETAGCGVLLQRMRQPAVVFLTDGAPRDPWFWRAHGSRERYAAVRRDEARAALAFARVRELHFFPGAADQELFRNLDAAQAWLDERIRDLRPEALLTLAYEGGHPDHDSCALLAHVAARRHALPAWEFPLYHRSLDGVAVRQEFLVANGAEVALAPSPAELETKRRMLAAYASQADVLQEFAAEVEQFRPQADYDFAAPPHTGVLNYEAWKWKMTGSEVAQAFSAHLARQPGRGAGADNC